MLLSQRSRAHTKWEEGYGGRYCACCGIAPSDKKKAKRAMRRIERREWKKECRELVDASRRE